MRASLFFSRDFPHQATQRFGEYFPALSLGLPMEPFSIRQTAKAARSRDFPAGSNLCRGLAHSFAEKK